MKKGQRLKTCTKFRMFSVYRLSFMSNLTHQATTDNARHTRICSRQRWQGNKGIVNLWRDQYSLHCLCNPTECPDNSLKASLLRLLPSCYQVLDGVLGTRWQWWSENRYRLKGLLVPFFAWVVWSLLFAPEWPFSTQSILNRCPKLQNRVGAFVMGPWVAQGPCCTIFVSESTCSWWSGDLLVAKQEWLISDMSNE